MLLTNTDFGDIGPVGLVLFNDWIVAFELVSILLLVALIGTVVLAKKRIKRAKQLGEKS